MQKIRDDTSIFKKYLFDLGFQQKLKILKSTNEVHNAFWDKLIFNKFKAIIGKNLRWVATGAAPVSQEVFDTIKVIFSVEYCQCYGLTETSGALFVNKTAELKAATHIG